MVYGGNSAQISIAASNITHSTAKKGGVVLAGTGATITITNTSISHSVTSGVSLPACAMNDSSGDAIFNDPSLTGWRGGVWQERD